MLRDTPIALGAQDICADAHGAFTGEVSAAMLKDVGCKYVIVGHSERRLLYRESDQLVARKFAAAHVEGADSHPVRGRAVGGARGGPHRRGGRAAARCGAGALRGGSPGPGVVAYEPVWAIGTGRNATPQQAQEVHAFIRARIAARDARIAAATRILYGGSVKAGNAAELFAMPDVDGGLIGGASLKADEFLAILARGAASADDASTGSLDPRKVGRGLYVASNFDNSAGVLVARDHRPRAASARQGR